MNIKSTIWRQKVFLSLKKWLISVFNPPYQLALSDKTFDKEVGYTIYIFKQYGSHDYIKVSYADILSNHSILSAINPINLMDIHLHEYLLKQEMEKYHISESLRDNQYKIANMKTEEIYSGDHICRNVDMFCSISHTDLCKIAYQSGFIKGRKMSQVINNLLKEKEEYESKEIVVAIQNINNIISLDSYRATPGKRNNS